MFIHCPQDNVMYTIILLLLLLLYPSFCTAVHLYFHRNCNLLRRGASSYNSCCEVSTACIGIRYHMIIRYIISTRIVVPRYSGKNVFLTNILNRRFVSTGLSAAMAMTSDENLSALGTRVIIIKIKIKLHNIN